MTNLDNLCEDQIIQRLKTSCENTYDLNPPLAGINYKKASVLMPLVRINKAWHILFIRRADSEKDRHSGQVAFVGGKAEAFDRSAIATALRESHEEIGLKPHDVKVLGKIACHYSVSQFEITPVVATIPWPYDFKLQTSEVSRTFTLPINWLADADNYEIKERLPAESTHKVPVIFYKEYEGELLWGASAKMMLSLINLLKSAP